jgi:hypothetical protein
MEDGTSRQTTYFIFWDQVNPSYLDDRLFDYRSFNGFWSNLLLIDSRDGKAEVLERPYRGDLYVVPEAVDATPQK